MLHLNNLVLRIAGRVLIDQASLHIPQGQKVALVGRNGTGKTSLLKLIAGEYAPDAGDVRLRSGARIGLIRQDAPGGEKSVLEATLDFDEERSELLKKSAGEKDYQKLAEIEERLRDIDAAGAPSRASRILKGLGFDDDAQSRPLKEFSGGWRMRVALAGLLLCSPDLLLLDEPTNHLDLEASIWLENYLKRYPHNLILVSHDRDFLNAVPDRIIHLEQQKLNAYSGNYDAFVKIRSEKRVLEKKLQEKQAAQRAHLQKFVDRFRYKESKAKQAQSRLKMIEKLGPVVTIADEGEIRFDFGGEQISNPPLMTMSRVSCGYGDKVILRNLDLRIDPEDRIALLGANGNGKSTFAKLVAGSLGAMEGELVRTNSLKIGFFAQHQIEALHKDKTPIEHLEEHLPEAREETIRSRLGRFGLIQDKAKTKAVHLSGGEKTRLSFALMCLGDPQILILDEPTNHLDIESRRALIDAINAFPGAVILVSHDRYLVEHTADQLWLVKSGRVTRYDDDMNAYRQMLLEENKTQDQLNKPQAKADKPISAAQKRSMMAPLRDAVKKAEKQLAALQQQQSALQEKLADPKTFQNGSGEKVQKELAMVEEKLVAAEEAWLEAETKLEEMAAS